MPLIILLNFPWLMWSWTDDTHITNQDIQELGEFIDREAFNDPSDSHFSRIILGDLVDRSGTGILVCLDEFFLKLECIVFIRFDTVRIFDAVFPVHVAEFIECERLSILPYPLILENNRSLGIFSLDEDGYGNPYRRQKYKRCDREDNIGETFQYTSPDGHPHEFNLSYSVVSNELYPALLEKNVRELY